MSAILYRKDIDGLRAIAVLSVVLYHAFPAYFRSGFIGVDIFFVISGYLISKGLLQNIEQGTFSIGDFYARRIRRIFPSLVVVLIFTVVISFFILTPLEFSSLGKHIVAGSLFFSNIQLWYEVDYFDQASNLKPLLHLWSLGVEEQFYIVWPLILYFLFPKSKLALHICLFILFSFLINLFLTVVDPSSAFYLPFSRFWELAAGALVVVIERSKFKILESNLVKNGFSIAGFLLLVLSFCIVDESMLFPSWIALLPVAGSCFLIIAGPIVYLNNLILSNRVSVKIGLLSYPWYLWHWPIFVFARISYGSVPPFKVRLLLFCVSFIFAYFTYKYIESLFRFGKLKTKAVNILLVAMSLVVLTGGLMQLQYFAGKTALAEKFDPTLIEAMNDWEYPGDLKSNLDNELSYLYHNDSENPGIVFFGDSHLQQYYPLIRILDSIKYPYYIVTDGGCPPIPVVQVLSIPKCSRLLSNFTSFLKNKTNVEKIIIAACWNCYFSPENNNAVGGENVRFSHDREADAAIEGFVYFVTELSKSYNVTVLGDNPLDARFDPRYYLNASGTRFDMLFSKHIGRGNFVTEFKMSDFQTALDTRFENAFKHTNVRFISVHNKICPEGICKVFDLKGIPKYKDDNHLRPGYVRSVFSENDDPQQLFAK